MDAHDIILADPSPLTSIDMTPASALFDGLVRTERNFLGAIGVRKGPSFKPDELSHIEALIKDQLTKNAAAISQTAADDIKANKLQDYHELAGRHDHRKLLSKTGRILNAATVAEIKKMSFFNYLKEGLGDDIYLSDEENVGHEQICFRIVRPNERNDVGSLHRDKWFWEHYEWPVPAGWARAKVWVQICGEPGLCGLMLAPRSHAHPGDYKVENVDGKVAFVPQFPMSEIDLRRYMGAVGEPVMFNYGVLHVGSINRSDVSRVSFEITVMFREQNAA